MENELLNKADKIINGQRNGYPEDVFEIIAEYWSNYLQMHIMPSDVASMMMLFKIARINPLFYHEDNYVDIMGYAAMAAKLARKDTYTPETYNTAIAPYKLEPSKNENFPCQKEE